jgi:hypothetical protein
MREFSPAKAQRRKGFSLVFFAAFAPLGKHLLKDR